MLDAAGTRRSVHRFRLAPPDCDAPPCRNQAIWNGELIHLRSSAPGALPRAVSASISDVRTWYDMRAMRRALTRLSDHELDDIGLMRSDIADLPRKLRRQG